MGRVVSERGPAWPESHRRRELYHTHYYNPTLEPNRVVPNKIRIRRFAARIKTANVRPPHAPSQYIRSCALLPYRVPGECLAARLKRCSLR